MKQQNLQPHRLGGHFPRGKLDDQRCRGFFNEHIPLVDRKGIKGIGVMHHQSEKGAVPGKTVGMDLQSPGMNFTLTQYTPA